MANSWHNDINDNGNDGGDDSHKDCFNVIYERLFCASGLVRKSDKVACMENKGGCCFAVYHQCY